MILTHMYPGVNNSPQTTLTTAITADATSISVADASVLPDGPNLATIGAEDNAEVIRYAAKSGNSLTGCERGFGGTTASVWPLSTPVYRAWTKYDYDTLIANINAVGDAVPDLSALEGMVKADGEGHLVEAEAGADYQAPLAPNVDYTTPETFEAHADDATIHVTAADKQKWDNPPSSPVQSVFGRTGAITAESGDYTPEQVGAAPAIHADRHATGGADPITPASIGAATDTHAAQHASTGSDPITPESIGAADKSELILSTLSADAWENASAPYTLTLSVAGVTTTSTQEILPALDITNQQLDALQAANLQDGGQAAGSITLKAFGDKPDMDIPIRIIKRGDL